MMPDNPDVDDLGKYGTASVLIFQNTIGSLPTRNYNEGQFEQCDPISGEGDVRHHLERARHLLCLRGAL
jgi:aldehyde:ferredoxin oxidoreductase